MKPALKLLSIWLPISLVGVLIYAICHVRINADKNLIISTKWSPKYSVALFNKNKKLLRPNLSSTDAKEIRANAIEGLIRAPLSHHPFVQMGEVNVYRNDLLGARALFSEVFKRNTRNRRALRVLVTLDIQKKNFKDAIQNLDILLKLKVSKNNRQEYHATLLGLSDNAQASKIIDDYLLARPNWGHKHVFDQIRSMSVSNFLKVGDSLKTYSSPQTRYTSDRQLHEFYLKRLQRMGKIDAAYTHWLSLIQTPQKSDYIVFNPDFDYRKELPPFNWSLVDKQEYFSEIDRGGGLYASYGDSEINILTEQTLRLTAGQAYRLNINAEWIYRKRQGMFFWSISCLRDGAIISSVNLDETTKAQMGGHHDFQVPLEGCHVQSLRLSAKPGQYSERVWSRTKSVNITMLQ